MMLRYRVQGTGYKVQGTNWRNARRRVGVLSGLWTIAFAFFATSCEGPEPPPSPDGPGADSGSVTSKVYVLCEGLWGMNNTTLFSWNVRSGETETAVFRTANKRGLGDTGNDLEIYGGKMYAVMNGSNTIEVMEASTARSLKQIPMVNENGLGRQPRYLCAHGGKVYVCSFDGSVCRIDTATLEIEAVTYAGRNPDGICLSNGKLYVSNSGGLDFPRCDSTVSVIDIESFREIKRLTVGHNPSTIAADRHGFVYVCTRGDYDGYRPSGNGSNDNVEHHDGYNFYKIDPAGDEVIQVFNLPVLNFCIGGDSAYIYNYDFGTKQGRVQVLNLLSLQIVCDDFIGESVALQTPYAVAADPHSGYVYIGEAYNYLRSGAFYVFKPDGELLHSFTAVGLNPSSFAFL